MLPADFVTLGMSIFADVSVEPIVVAIIGTVIFGQVIRGLRRFFA